jgi:glucose/arabinose dehydrogenase
MDRRTLLRAGGASLALAPLAVAAPADARPRVGAVLASNLEVPWGIAFLPNGDALVSERMRGRISRVSRHGGRTTVGTISAADPNAGEGGLLGLAVHPNFKANRWLYAYFTTANDNRIARMRYENGQLGPRQVVLSGIPHASNHNGGRLAFGPDGMLYATTGDATNSSNSQDQQSLGGKVLRITPTGGVPAGNPFGNEVWSMGHRNVEGIAFDRNGRTWATEFGSSTRDELNRIVAGDNYGWPDVEGGDGSGGFHDPFVTWQPTSECSPSGVAIARGKAWVGALAGDSLYSVQLDGPNRRQKRRWFEGRFGRIRTVERAPDGSLWIATSNRDGRGTPGPNDDRIIRITLG